MGLVGWKIAATKATGCHKRTGDGVTGEEGWGGGWGFERGKKERGREPSVLGERERGIRDGEG